MTINEYNIKVNGEVFKMFAPNEFMARELLIDLSQKYSENEIHRGYWSNIHSSLVIGTE